MSLLNPSVATAAAPPRSRSRLADPLGITLAAWILAALAALVAVLLIALRDLGAVDFGADLMLTWALSMLFVAPIMLLLCIIFGSVVGVLLAVAGRNFSFARVLVSTAWLVSTNVLVTSLGLLWMVHETTPPVVLVQVLACVWSLMLGASYALLLHRWAGANRWAARVVASLFVAFSALSVVLGGLSG
ncbi:hypothetical protein NWP10_06995 [Micrococcus sp. HG099]|uniref:hypothetical protein n=1 Tax=Micrococcus sp. HG099 TaxID=2969755 RepID=UPI00215A1341|nr:hypothetical protein [Micrococcus sp. HG099]MCR8675548.1 hypothetical protein [Micrococcus sp. HG099]